MSKDSIVQLSLKANEELVKRTKQKQSQKFYMLGAETLVNRADKGEKANWEMVGMNSIEKLINMSKREQAIIGLMIRNITWDKNLHSLNYVVELTPDSVDFDKRVDKYMAYSSFLKGFASLHAEDIMRRVSKHKYMLNPQFLIPTGELAPRYRLIWDESKMHKSLIADKPVKLEN